MTSKGNTTSDQVLKQTVSKSNLLDSEVPSVDSTPILQPKKYKRQYRKPGNFSKGKNKIKKRIVKTFDKFWNLKPGKSSESTEESKKRSWYEKLKESIIDVFWKKDLKFELDKKALNATAGLSFFDPEKVLKEVKPLVLEKFKENFKTKKQIL